MTSVSVRRGAIWRPLLIGAVVGGALGWVVSTGDDGGFPSLSPEAWIGLGAAEGASVGAGIGVAHTRRFRIEPDARLGAADSLAAP